MKKILLALFLVLSIFLFAACGGATALPEEPTNNDFEIVEDASESLSLPGLDSVTNDINLPITGPNGTTIKWESSNPSFITNDGTVTRPEEGEDNATITLFATVSLNDESVIRSFEVLVIAFKLDDDIFTNFFELYESTSINDLITVQGIVSSVFEGGFFIFDGTEHFGVYIGSTGTGGGLVNLGDKVRLKGIYSRYYTLYQLTDVENVEVLSSGNIVDDESIPITIEEWNALDLDDPLIHGDTYELTGTLVQKGEFNNLFLTSSESNDEILVYYYSDQDSLLALEAYVGTTITLELVYYTNHASNGIMAIYYGDGSDVKIVTETGVNIPDTLSNEPIEIVIWHAFGEDNQALLQDMFDSFNEEYPQVTITQLGQGGYDGLRESTIQSIVAGTTPTIVFGYPDHFVEYLNGNALVPLDEYIEHDVHGVNLDDFVDGFLAENQQYLDGNQYSMPFAKSTEMVVYNKDYFDAQGIELSRTTPLTWGELEELADTMVGSGANQCDFLFNADSASNFFINNSRQWDAGYTDGEGNILVDNDETRDMLNYFDGLFDQDIVSFPIEWDENYGSEPFKDGLVCMSQGSTAGTRFNIPDESSPFNEMGIVPVIQRDLDNASVMQQGPNVAVISDADNNQRLAAWLLLKHMTNTENTADFAMSTGYVPVRKSGFETAEYQEFLSLVDKYDVGGIAGLTPSERLDLPFAMAATVAYAQVNWYQYDPAFVRRVTSSGARQEAGLAFEAIYAGTRTVEEAIGRMLNQLGQ